MSDLTLPTYKHLHDAIQHFSEFFREGHLVKADAVLTATEGIVDGLDDNDELRKYIRDNPTKLNTLVSGFLSNFHLAVEHCVMRSSAGAATDSYNDERVRLMWRVWPPLHRILSLQADCDGDMSQYTANTAELYGVLGQAMESKYAMEHLLAVYDKVFPLPHG